jgi:adenosylcobyric acid synthase
MGKGAALAKALMIQGTGSGVGKSLIVAALCRIFKDLGVKVAPFKAQNMALNSFITTEGGEIGRAQALQAEAAGVTPRIDMNPILLKASGDMGSQVIIHGKAYKHMTAREYYAFKKEAWEAVQESYRRLSADFELIIIEGAGSPAEINLVNVDIVNMAAAKLAKAPVLLVGDIDKGGVFASLYGTIKLLNRDSRHIKGFIINKFRGDHAILKPGLRMIQEKTNKPVIGVLPHVSDPGLPEEDGLALKTGSGGKGTGAIRIIVLRLKYISNFTDFDPIACEPDTQLIYSNNPDDIENADLVVIPGSKNTVQDLFFLRDNHLDKSIERAYKKGIQVIGLCGGYQMLGKKIYDPNGVESAHQEMDGLGLLNIETFFEGTKTTCQVEAEINSGSRGQGPGSWQSKEKLTGYEIHMGRSTGDIGLFKVRRFSEVSGDTGSHRKTFLDGSANGNCWGTYLHGIFDNNVFRRGILNQLRTKKGLPPLPVSVDYDARKQQAICALSDMVRENIDMRFIRRMVGL